jgi:hypothetical protein
MMRNRLSLLMWIAAATLTVGVPMRAQWLHEPTTGAPRTRDGQVIMTGRVPRANGKPDLSGLSFCTKSKRPFDRCSWMAANCPSIRRRPGRAIQWAVCAENERTMPTYAEARVGRAS